MLKPHIGCAVLAIPRPSLKSDGSMSCTSSVLNLSGHKDETLCRLLAERACVSYRQRTIEPFEMHRLYKNSAGKTAKSSIPGACTWKAFCFLL